MVQAIDDLGGDLEQPELLQGIQLLGEMNNNVKQVSNLVENMLTRVKNGEVTTENGLSFLEVKYHMLLNYLINLTYIVLRKCSGKKIENDPSIERLIEIRTVLERIHPIDHKLRYQIDKLVKTAVTGDVNDASDPISFKPKPSNLISQINDNETVSTEESSSDESETNETKNKNDLNSKANKKLKSTSKTNLYVPPKLTPMHYDGDETNAEKTRKQLERAKKRAMSSSIINDLKEEYLDTPLEIIGGSKAQQMYTQKQKERQDYEEMYLTRLPTTKLDKINEKKLTTLNSLGDEIIKFNDSFSKNKKSATTSRKRKFNGKSKKRGVGGSSANKKRKMH